MAEVIFEETDNLGEAEEVLSKGVWESPSGCFKTVFIEIL